MKRLGDENQKNPAIILVGSKADQDEGLHMGLPLTEIAAEFCKQNEISHLLISSKENSNIDVLLGWIRGQIAKIVASEDVSLQDMASLGSSRVQLDLDEDYLMRGSSRHIVLDDSCC